MPFVLIVRQLKDGKQLVAKVNSNPEEKQILEFLQTRERASEQVISFIGSFSSNIGQGILFPLRRSVLQLLTHPGEHRGRFLQFAEDLIKGVAFLHRHFIAHRDIKPDNLVYTDAFRLQIIDFDVATRLIDADQLLDENVGTEGYKAPEIEDIFGPRLHSPIRADRWSCGLTISCFLVCSDQKGRQLYQNLECFSHQLMDKDPEYRPSLCEWFKLPNNERDDAKVMAVAPPRKRRRVEENHDYGGL